jgi:hypothetical protein
MRVESISYYVSILLALGMLAGCAQPISLPNQVASPFPETVSATSAPARSISATPQAPSLQPTSPFVQTTKIVPTISSPKETTVSKSPTLPNEIDPNLEPLIQQAVKDLAERLNISPDQIEVLAAGSVVWSDPSMGCPAPDMRYIQIPQDGALIRLQAGGQVYEYHSGGNKPPFLCENP